MRSGPASTALLPVESSLAVADERGMNNGGTKMPLVQLTVFAGEFTEDQEIIEAVTDRVVTFTGESLGSATWTVVE